MNVERLQQLIDEYERRLGVNDVGYGLTIWVATPDEFTKRVTLGYEVDPHYDIEMTRLFEGDSLSDLANWLEQQTKGE